MKSLILAILLISPMSMGSVHTESIYGIDGNEIKLDQYKGKVVLFVNIATKCGFTKQLKGLEALYQKYKGSDFVVVGIPSNDFAGQTPESEQGVKKFCALNYGVTFPLTAKTVVKGPQKHTLITNMIANTRNIEIGWNFEKFLVNKEGKVIGRYKSKVTPNNPSLLQAIEKAI